MDERQLLLAVIERFCDWEGTSPTAFGRKAMGDGRFIDGLRDESPCYWDLSSTIERTEPGIGNPILNGATGQCSDPWESLCIV